MIFALIVLFLVFIILSILFYYVRYKKRDRFEELFKEIEKKFEEESAKIKNLVLKEKIKTKTKIEIEKINFSVIFHFVFVFIVILITFIVFIKIINLGSQTQLSAVNITDTNVSSLYNSAGLIMQLLPAMLILGLVIFIATLFTNFNNGWHD